MKVQLERTFALPAAADTAWMLLQDIEQVAGCMPGAKITERLGERLYKGTVAVKLGPASMSFRGDVEVMALDPATKTLRIVGKGTDSTGGSGASMDLTARVEAIDAVSCSLVGNSEVSMSGKAAAFGGRMMNSVADQLMKQFATNFTARVQALQARSPPPAAPVEAGAEPAAEAPAETAAEAPAAPAPVAPPPATQLNALALLWAVVKDWLRSLFSPRKA
jgi:hypothetical protein